MGVLKITEGRWIRWEDQSFGDANIEDHGLRRRETEKEWWGQKKDSSQHITVTGLLLWTLRASSPLTLNS